MPRDKDDSDDTPFITGRSPSSARAQEEHKNPAPTADPGLVAALSRLVELDHAAAAALEVAIGRLTDPHMEQLELEGQRHSAASLAEIVDDLGASAPTADEADLGILPCSATEIEYCQNEAGIRQALERNRQHIEQGRSEFAESDASDVLRARVAAALAGARR